MKLMQTAINIDKLTIASAEQPKQRLLGYALCALPFLFALQFISQAQRDYTVGMDFRLTYSAAAAWLQGLDPYDDAALKDVWSRAGMAHATPPGHPQTPNVYPISVAPLLAPLAWLSFPTALVIWMLINAGCVATWVWQLYHHEKVPPIFRCAAIVILLFGFPLQYGLRFGNLAVVTSFLITTTLFQRHRPMFAGACLGLALVKHSLCAPLVLLFLFEKRWKFLFTAAGVYATLLLAGSLVYAGPTPWAWIGAMMNTGMESLAVGGINHHARLDGSALHLTTAALLYRVHPALVHLDKVILVVLGFAILRGCWRRTTTMNNDLRPVTPLHIALLGLNLMAYYHRLYDLVVVMMPLLMWLLIEHDRLAPRWRSAFWFIAVLMMLPGATVGGGMPNVSWPVLALIQPIGTWSLLLGVGCLAAWAWLASREYSDRPAVAATESTRNHRTTAFGQATTPADG